MAKKFRPTRKTWRGTKASAPKYKDTRDGVLKYLKADSTLVKKGNSNVTYVIPDPQVDGVWKVNFDDGGYAIVYLGGYECPFGDVREMDDFEYCEPPRKQCKRITIGNARQRRALAKKSQSICMTDMACFEQDLEMIEDNLVALAEELRYEGHRLHTGYTTWRPLGGKKWRAIDGSELEVSLAELIEGWAERGKLDDICCETDWCLEHMIDGYEPKGE